MWLRAKLTLNLLDILIRFDDNVISKRNPVGRQSSERRLRAVSEANLLAGGSNVHSK